MLTRILLVGSFLFSVAPLHGENIYRSDFSKMVSPEIWSFSDRYELEPGGERVLGRVRSQGSISMTHKELPAHALVRVQFDLLLFGTFDGNSAKLPLDGFSVAIKDGPLLYTTNFNTWKAGKNGRQSFPDEWPAGDHPSQTGRVAGGDADGPQRYRFDMTFPHSEKELTLRLRGRVHVKEFGWGFSNVQVDVFDKVKELPADRADALWKSLNGKDATAAQAAAWQLIACGDAGLKAVEKRLKERAETTKKRELEKTAAVKKAFDTAVAGLASDDFAKRQKASSEIGKLGPATLPLVEKSLADKATPAGIRIHLKRLQKRLATKKDAAGGSTKMIDSRIAQVRRVLDRSRAGMRATSSKEQKNNSGWDGPDAVLDGFTPPTSATLIAPRFSWYPKFIGNGWLRVDLEKRREISKLGVFWFFAGWGTKAPASWKLEYLAADGKTWKPVENPSAYGTEADKFNEVTFDKIETGAVRITATFDGKKSTGVQELYVK